MLTYQPALELKGDPNGAEWFTQNLYSVPSGRDVRSSGGADFASVKNKSPDDPLIAILTRIARHSPLPDVHRDHQQGKIYTGIISAETEASITLKRAEAKEDVVLRDTLDNLVSSGLSLMPEGLEKDLDPSRSLISSRGSRVRGNWSK